MTYKSLGDKYSTDIEQARAEVYDAQIAYAKGEGVDQLNAANRKLADAHSNWRQYCGQRIPENS